MLCSDNLLYTGIPGVQNVFQLIFIISLLDGYFHIVVSHL